MSRMAGDVDDEAEGSAAETVEDFAAETAAHSAGQDWGRRIRRPDRRLFRRRR